MPLDVSIHPKLNLILIRGWDTLDAADLLSAHEEIQRMDGFSPTMRQLADFSEVLTVTASSEVVRPIAKGAVYDPGARCAIVAGSEVVFGMGRMYQQLRDGDGESVRVCSTMEEALAWLDLTSADLPQTPRRD